MNQPKSKKTGIVNEIFELDKQMRNVINAFHESEIDIFLRDFYGDLEKRNPKPKKHKR